MKKAREKPQFANTRGGKKRNSTRDSTLELKDNKSVLCQSS